MVQDFNGVLAEDWKKNVGRPVARWVDGITSVVGQRWMRVSQDRVVWQEQRAYIQQWIK